MGDWNKIETIIDQALTLPERKRHKFIDKVCGENAELKGEVSQLLASIAESEGWLDDPQKFKNNLYQEIAEDVESLDTRASLIGHRVGAYTIREKLGQGGMGTVYRAERSDGTFEHQVAIKLIRSERATPDNIRRFKQEQNILAGLNHPGIAQLFDGGITEAGIPYLVMEYIDGIPIDEYCQKKKLAINQCIKLFQEVLSAVMHAHENLVIHRDLKPGNILVTDQGSVKILDFGISKLLEDSENQKTPQTLTHGRLLTPKYAAPEQIAEEAITTATDLYALGTIFYELISGSHPLPLEKRSQFETEQLILEGNPPAPSNNLSECRKDSKQKLKGDLDAIALKALRKEPERRYRTANQFWQDLDNYKQGMPVSAHSDSFRYRGRKFIQRHKLAITAAGAFLVLIISFASIYTLRIAEERNNAQMEADKAMQIKHLLTNILKQSNPFNQPNRDITLAEVLDKGTRDVQNSLQHQPQVKAELLGLIGDNYASLGNFSKGEQLLNNAIELYEPSQLQSAQQSYINNLSRLGTVYMRTGRFKKAKATYIEALELIKRAYGEQSKYASDIYGSLAAVYREEGQFLKTEEYFKMALALADSTQQLVIAISMGNLANAYRDQGLFEKAIELHQRSIKLQSQMRPAPNPNLASAYNNLAFTYQQKGNFKQADSLHQIALSMRRSLFPANHHHIASSLIRIGLLKIKQFHTREAEKYLKEGYEILSSKLPENHWQVISARGGLAVSRAMQGDFETNVPIVEEAYRKFIEKFGTDDWRTHEAASALANLYQIWGKPEKASYYARRLE